MGQFIGELIGDFVIWALSLYLLLVIFNVVSFGEKIRQKCQSVAYKILFSVLFVMMTILIVKELIPLF